jgi:hypothetical protein
MGKVTNAYKILVARPEVKRTHGRIGIDGGLY